MIDLQQKTNEIKEVLGTEQFLNELLLALDSTELEASLRHIDRMYDLDIFTD